MIASGILSGLGGLLGAFGSASAASSANNAATNANNQSTAEREAARNRLGLLMFGPQDWQDFLLATQPDTTTYQSRPSALGSLFGSDGKTYKTDHTKEKAAAAARFFSKYPSLQGIMQQANQTYQGEQDALLGRERDRTAQLDTLARGQEGMGQDLLEQQQRQIARDADRRLKSLNRVTTGQLGYLGPSTLTGNQLASNSRQVGEQASDANLRAAMASTDRTMAARGQRMNLLNQRYGLMGSLEDTVSGRRRQATMEPAQAANAAMNGGMFAPHSFDASAFAPYSPFAAAMGSVAPALTQLGGYGLLGGFGGGQQGSPAVQTAASNARQAQPSMLQQPSSMFGFGF